MHRTVLALLIALCSSLAWAHPGEHHAGFLHSLAHLLTEPDHLALMLLAGVAGWAGARFLRRRKAVRTQPPRH